MRIQSRRDERPNLPEQKRHGQSNRGIQRDFDIKREGLDGRRHHQLVVGVGQLVVSLAQIDGQLHVFRHHVIPGGQSFIGEETEISLRILVYASHYRSAGWNQCLTKPSGFRKNEANLVVLFQRTQRQHG